MTDQPAHSELPPSSADKWFHCHAWRRFTHGIEDTSSSAAIEGTKAHEWLADHLLGNRDLVDCDDPEMADLLFMCVDWIEAQEGKRYVETRVDFGGAFGFIDLTGTADLIFVGPDEIHVADLKYGRQVVEVENNLQLMTYLVGAVHEFGSRPSYRISILQPRAWHANGSTRSWQISHKDFLEFSRALQEAIQGSYGFKAEPTAGPWCQHYCKALARCPAAAKMSLDAFRNHPLEES